MEREDAIRFMQEASWWVRAFRELIEFDCEVLELMLRRSGLGSFTSATETQRLNLRGCEARHITPYASRQS